MSTTQIVMYVILGIIILISVYKIISYFTTDNTTPELSVPSTMMGGFRKWKRAIKKIKK